MAARAASHCLGDGRPLVEATSRRPRGFEAADHLSNRTSWAALSWSTPTSWAPIFSI